MQVSQFRTPSGVNGAASVVAHSKANPGLRASTPSNLDSTGRCVVKRGSVVKFPGGATGRVSRVRLGYFWTDLGLMTHRPFSCARVSVVS